MAYAGARAPRNGEGLLRSRVARIAALVTALAVMGPIAQSSALAPTKLTVAAGTPNIDYGGFAGDGGPATQALLDRPADVLPLAGGGFLLSDGQNHRIRRVDADGVITTVAGSGPLEYHDQGGDGGDGGPADQARLAFPAGLAPMPDGGYALSDSYNHRIRRVDANGIITTIVGNGTDTSTGSGDTASTIGLKRPGALDAFPDGTLVFVDFDPNGEVNTIFKVTPAGDVTNTGLHGRSVAVDDDGGFFYSDVDGTVKHVDALGAVTTVAGNGEPAPAFELTGQDATQVGVGDPYGLVATPDGGVEFWTFTYPGGPDFGGQLIRVDSAGKATTILERDTLTGALARAPEGLVIGDPVYHAVFLLHKTFLESGPPAQPGPGVTNGSPQFTFSSPDAGATFECRLDAGDWDQCSGPTFQYSQVSDGPHTFAVRAIDAGNVADPSPETTSFSTDASPPAAFALAGPADGATTGARPTLTWNATTDALSPVDRYEVYVDGAKVGTVQPESCGATCSFQVPTLTDGTHQWSVAAYDEPGSKRTSAVRSLVVAAVPVASFTVTPNLALTGQRVTFDGSASSVANGRIASYEWDLDGDGSFETDSGSSPTVTRSYSEVARLQPQLRVRTPAGTPDRAVRSLEIRLAPPAGPVGASIEDGAQFTNDPHVMVWLRWPDFTRRATVSNDGGFADAQVFPVARQIPWTLRSSGPERLPKTIYVRFDDSTQTFSDDIILDETAPAIQSASIDRDSGDFVLRLSASDRLSGVSRMQVARDRGHPQKWRKFKRKRRVRNGDPVWVRVRDRAGNRSRWRHAKPANR